MTGSNLSAKRNMTLDRVKRCSAGARPELELVGHGKEKSGV